MEERVRVSGGLLYGRENKMVKRESEGGGLGGKRLLARLRHISGGRALCFFCLQELECVIVM